MLLVWFCAELNVHLKPKPPLSKALCGLTGVSWWWSGGRGRSNKVLQKMIVR